LAIEAEFCSAAPRHEEGSDLLRVAGEGRVGRLISGRRRGKNARQFQERDSLETLLDAPVPISSRPLSRAVTGRLKRIGAWLGGIALLPVPALLLVAAAPHSASGYSLGGAGGGGGPTWAQVDRAMESNPALTFTPGIGAPLPLAGEHAGREREVFGFVPYWMLDTDAEMSLSTVTALSYFGVEIGSDGRIEQSGNDWRGYQSQALVDLIDRAHTAGIPVYLTAKSFDQSTLDRLASSAMARSTLASQLVDAVDAKRLDGVNLDLEGAGSSDRAGVVELVTTVAESLHSVNPMWQVTVDTYASSAIDSAGFFDIPRLAQASDALFVMAYDMYQSGLASPNASIAEDRVLLAAYLSKAPASKLIMGTPFYGYDWPTRSNQANAKATGVGQPVTFAEVAKSALPTYWDAKAQEPWTAYHDGTGQWHEVYFDNPQSIAAKARLVSSLGLRGIGAWALGMEGGDDDMLEALDGKAPLLNVGGASGSPQCGNSCPSPIVGVSSGSAPGSQPAPRPAASASPSPAATPRPSPSPSPTPVQSPTPCPSPSSVPLPCLP